MAPILFAASLGLLIAVPAFSKDKPIPVKVVVITMFERGPTRAMSRANFSIGSNAIISIALYRSHRAFTICA